GIIRDVLVSKNVPTSLENPFFALISIASAVIVIFFYNKFTTTNTRKIIQYLDAAGLAAFTAIGARVAMFNGFDQPYIIITFAVLTGTGGGIIRDVFAREIPFVFRKEVYAVASIIGAVVYMIAWEWFGPPAALYSCLAATLFIRIYSMEKDLHLDCVKK
ncbi:MAG: trimeric intracellular cation channel family protein, partial [Clostridia bacterium]|nr:trimeric intracellular cation channel family protein [Clostridia bacterium]